MTEKEKCQKGLLHNANYDQALFEERQKCKELCHDYNLLRPGAISERQGMLRSLLDARGKTLWIEQPFYCDFGYNISVGENFFANFNLVILDEATVSFGDNVFIGPNCSFYTAGHPLDVERRNEGLEYARPISVGDNVWFGGNVVVLPGVNIGDNCVIGAGSVVTRDIPADSLAVGNPCKVIKSLKDINSTNPESV